MISALRCFAKASEVFVFPTPVGPVRTTTRCLSRLLASSECETTVEDEEHAMLSRVGVDGHFLRQHVKPLFTA